MYISVLSIYSVSVFLKSTVYFILYLFSIVFICLMLAIYFFVVYLSSISLRTLVLLLNLQICLWNQHCDMIVIFPEETVIYFCHIPNNTNSIWHMHAPKHTFFVHPDNSAKRNRWKSIISIFRALASYNRCQAQTNKHTACFFMVQR